MKTKKEEYIDKMAAQLKEWSTSIDELESRASGAAADIKKGYESRIRSLKSRRDALARELQEFRQSSDEAWGTMKGGLEMAWHDFKRAFAEAKQKLKRPA